METINTMEPVLFTTISEDEIYKAPASEVIKFIAYICATHDLNVKMQSDYKKATEILIKSIKYN
jgi:hypothetical protein